MIWKDPDLPDGLGHGDPVQLGEFPLPEQGVHPGPAEGIVLLLPGELGELAGQGLDLCFIVRLIGQIVCPAEKIRL